MDLVRSRRTRHSHAVLALVRDDLLNSELHNEAYRYISIDDIRKGAEKWGYDVAEFWLGKNDLKPERLNEILLARGIEGILISPQSIGSFSANLDYSCFASVTFGYGLSTPQIDRASTNMMDGILTAMRVLEKRGYQRIGVAVTQWVNTRADHTYSGAVLHYQQGKAKSQRVPFFLLPHDELELNKKKFCEWVKRYKPDAIITFYKPVVGWLREQLGLRIPQDIGLVAHDWDPGMTEFAGIDHRREYVAAAAVDMLARQLQHNEHGIPEVARQILIPPRFVDGPSIREA